jgi:hypothetical protein
MPKQTTAKGFPRDPADCYESRHLTSSQFKVYHVVRNCAWSWRRKKEGDSATGPLIFNASVLPWLCNAVPMSKNFVRKMIGQLVKLGWMILIQEGKHRQDGTQEPNTYRVLEHPEFVTAHPGSCPPNMYAPNFEEAEKYGVRYGDKMQPDQVVVPRNFWPSPDTPLGSALLKITGEKVMRLTDEESTALREHFAETPSAVTAKVTETPIAVTDSYRDQVQAGTAIESEQLPRSGPGRYRDRGQNVVTAFETASTHPHTQPENGVSVCVDTKTLDKDLAEKEVAILQSGFVKHNGGIAGNCSRGQKDRMIELAMQHGREKFRVAAKAWLKASPWDDNTTHPFSAFISGFDGYAGTQAYADQKKADDERKKESLKESYAIARKQHEAMYPDLAADDVAAETLFEDLTLEQIQAEIATAAHKPRADERMKEINERKATSDEEREQAIKALKEGKW